MQFLPRQFDFVFDRARGLPIQHRTGESETIRAGGAFRNQIIELRDANRAADFRTVLFQIKVGSPKSAIGIRSFDRPVSGKLTFGLLGRRQKDNDVDEQQQHERYSHATTNPRASSRALSQQQCESRGT